MKQRIITGVVAGSIFVLFVVYGGWLFALLTFALAAVGIYELLKMKGMSIFSIPGILALLATILLAMPKDWAAEIEQVISYNKLELVFIATILLLVYSVIVKNKFTYDDIAFVILSTMYVGIGFYYLYETREAGIKYIILALVIVWVTDSGAYFTGRKLGKRKLWPEISPNKTVEGFIGGIVLAVIGVVIMQMIAPFDVSWAMLLFVTIFSSIFGQMGDLVESAIKRHYGVKDSGSLLPGHGGILDRFDSLLFVLPLLNLLHFVS